MKIIIVIMLVVLLGLVALLYVAAANMEEGTVRAWAIVATLAIVPAFIGGMIVGNLEARGKISGIDLAMEKLGRTYEHASKTQADIEAKRRPPETTVQIMNGMPDGRLLPPISHRQIANDDEVIDL